MFLKSVLKNKKKLKVPVRYRGTLLFFDGTGTTKVPTVPVPQKYRGTSTYEFIKYSANWH